MQKYIEERVLGVYDFMLNTQSTFREAAKEFKVSKTTVWLDISKRLKKHYPQKYLLIRPIILNNLNERSHRGGMSTHLKYKKDI